MTSQEIQNLFNHLGIFKRGNERAPHKPLLLLLAIGYLQKGQRNIPFADIQEKLSTLLEDYGPPRRRNHPEYPFVRLVADGLWELSDKSIQPGSDPSPGMLVKKSVNGGFTPEVFQILGDDSMLLSSVVRELLESNFPDSLHDDILISTGVQLLSTSVTRRVRDPHFRELVLEAYGYKCAVCGLGVRLRHSLVALEAAHIKWHQAGGPDIVENGLALCSLHHKFLDVGAFTVDADHRFIVSPKANGPGLQEALLSYQGTVLQYPTKKNHYPEHEFLDWHVNEVFKAGYSSRT
jgi:putative restriction endonuclease